MKHYTKAQFLKDVAAEAKALKKNATKEELGELDFDTLEVANENRCVYGQMTGSCKSERAAILISSCCKRFFHNGEDDPETMEIVEQQVNGKTVDGFVEQRKNQDWVKYFSSIEQYILTPFAQNKNLIAYLKGERKDLVL